LLPTYDPRGAIATIAVWDSVAASAEDDPLREPSVAPHDERRLFVSMAAPARQRAVRDALGRTARRCGMMQAVSRRAAVMTAAAGASRRCAGRALAVDFIAAQTSRSNSRAWYVAGSEACR
jgi:hypothetical protein